MRPKATALLPQPGGGLCVGAPASLQKGRCPSAAGDQVRLSPAHPCGTAQGAPHTAGHPHGYLAQVTMLPLDDMCVSGPVKGRHSR